MKLSEYQKAAFFTGKPGTPAHQWFWGVAGELGEVVDALKKKFLRQNPTISLLDIADEIGDLLWYCCAIHTAYEIDVTDFDIVYPPRDTFDFTDWIADAVHFESDIIFRIQKIRKHGETLQQFAGSGAMAMPAPTTKEDVCENVSQLMAHCLVLLHKINIDLETVLERNIRKLRAKYNNEGYISDAERLARDDRT